jgi:hypothetical protein
MVAALISGGKHSLQLRVACIPEIFAAKLLGETGKAALAETRTLEFR